jgi:hypothetical protein
MLIYSSITNLLCLPRYISKAAALADEIINYYFVNPSASYIIQLTSYVRTIHVIKKPGEGRPASHAG